MDITLQDYTSHHIIPAHNGRKCVDGRYEDTEFDQGMIACAGADFGSVMVLLTLNREKNWGFTPEECVEKVYSALVEKGDIFYMHTDTHASSDGTIGEHCEVGCGHAGKAMNPELAPLYDVDPEDVKKALLYIRKLQLDHNEKIVVVNLPGEHAEEGVITVIAKDKSIQPHAESHMYFIYDSERYNEYAEDLVKHLHISDLTLEDFKRVAQKQLTATLHNLAAGKQIFNVDLTHETPIITPGPVVQ
jgi:hypothetical protein